MACAYCEHIDDVVLTLCPFCNRKGCKTMTEQVREFIEPEKYNVDHVVGRFLVGFNTSQSGWVCSDSAVINGIKLMVSVHFVREPDGLWVPKTDSTFISRVGVIKDAVPQVTRNKALMVATGIINHLLVTCPNYLKLADAVELNNQMVVLEDALAKCRAHEQELLSQMVELEEKAGALARGVS